MWCHLVLCSYKDYFKAPLGCPDTGLAVLVLGLLEVVVAPDAFYSCTGLERWQQFLVMPPCRILWVEG